MEPPSTCLKLFDPTSRCSNRFIPTTSNAVALFRHPEPIINSFRAMNRLSGTSFIVLALTVKCVIVGSSEVQASPLPTVTRFTKEEANTSNRESLLALTTRQLNVITVLECSLKNHSGKRRQVLQHDVTRITKTLVRRRCHSGGEGLQPNHVYSSRLAHATTSQNESRIRTLLLESERVLAQLNGVESRQVYSIT